MTSVGVTANFDDEGHQVIPDNRHHLQSVSEYLPELARRGSSLPSEALHVVKLCTPKGV